MARHPFGGSAADFLFTATSGRLVRLASGSLTFWTAETGGTQHTDLILNGAPASSIPVGADGQVPTFSGPDGVTQMWASAGGGRVVMVSLQGVAEASTTARDQATEARDETTAARDQVLAFGDTQEAMVAGFVDGDGPVRTSLNAAIENDGAGPQRLDPMPGQVQAVARGVVGLGGKTPVAIRHDDDHNVLKSLGIPAGLHSRALPWGLASISRQNIQSWFTSAAVSWEEVRGWAKGGMELWSHGIDHQSPYDPDPDVWRENIREQIVTSKAELQAQSFRVQGLMMPGVSAPGYGNYLTSVANWNSDVGRLIQATYGLAETDMHGYFRELPSTARYGLAHFTISDTAYTLAQIQGFVNEAIETGRGIELMIHAGMLGGVGKLPVATYWAVMDWLKTLRDAGTIEVVTPSSLFFCDPRATHRPDLIADNDFTSTTTGAADANVWQNIDGVNNVRATVNDGPNNRMAGVLRINTTAGTPVLTEPGQIDTSQRNNCVLMTQFKARRVSATPTTLRVENRSIYPYDVWPVAEDHVLTESWATYRQTWNSHINTNRIRSSISTTLGGVAEVTDFHLYLA